MTCNHAVLIFALREPTLFIGFTAFTLYALLVVAIPFRRRERWAWYTSWALPVGLALPGLDNPTIAPYYLATAAVCAAALLLSAPDFFRLWRPASQPTV